MVIGKLPLDGWAVIISTAEIDKLTPYSFLPSVQNTTAHQSRPVYRFHIILYGTARRHRRTTRGNGNLQAEKKLYTVAICGRLSARVKFSATYHRMRRFTTTHTTQSASS